MALDLGELVGYLKLDTKEWDGPLDEAPEKAKGKAGKFALAGGLLGGALAAALMSGISDALNFDQTLANVQAGFGLTEQQAASAGAIAADAYGQNFGESMEQVQTVVGSLMTSVSDMAGASDASLEAATAKVLTYASAFEVDTADAVNQVSQLMNSGLASSTTEAMDLMTSAMQQVPAALRGDLTDAITEYGPHLAKMGYSGEEAFAMLVTAAEGGQYGIDKTGDAMKELSIRSTDMSTTSTEAYEAMGLDAKTMADKMLAGGASAREATDEIVAGLLSMEDPSAQANAAIALFGTPLEDLSVTEIPAFLEGLTSLEGGMGDTSGAAQGMVDTMGGTAASGMAGFQRQIQLVFATLGEQFLPILTTVFGYLNEHTEVLTPLVIGLGVLAVGLGIAAAAQWAMNSAMLASPVTWIIVGVLAVIAAIVLLVANWDTVVAWLGDVWGAVVDWFKGTLDAIAEWWGSTWQAVSDFFVSLWQGISDFFVGLWEGLVAGVEAIVQGYIDGFRAVWQGIVDWFGWLWDHTAGAYIAMWVGLGARAWAVIQGIVAWFRSTWSGLIGWFTGVWSGVTGFFSGLWTGVYDGVLAWWDNVVGFFEGMPAKIMGFFADAGSWLWDAGKNIVNGLLKGVGSVAGTIGTFFLDKIPGWIKGPFKKALGINSPSTVFEGYAVNTVEGYLRGAAKMKPALDDTMANLVDPQELRVASTFSGTAQAQAAAAANTKGARTVNYYAAEHQSLNAEEALFAALASPRVGV